MTVALLGALEPLAVVPAALFMARSMTLLRMEALRDLPPRVLVRTCVRATSRFFCASSSATRVV